MIIKSLLFPLIENLKLLMEISLALKKNIAKILNRMLKNVQDSLKKLMKLN